MYSLTKPLSTVVLSMDAIRLKSFEEKFDVASSPVLGTKDCEDVKCVVLSSNLGSSEGSNLGVTPGSRLMVTPS